jgi:hypothetical protein
MEEERVFNKPWREYLTGTGCKCPHAAGSEYYK